MGTRIPESTKILVYQKLMLGLSRDQIAAECGVSGGAVSSILFKLKESIGVDLFDQIRALSMTLRKMGIPVAEAMRGLRVLNTMMKLGVDEEGFESFLLQTYHKCTEFGLNPEQIGSYLKDLVDFWSANDDASKKEGGIPFYSEIPGYMAKVKEDKTNVEDEIRKRQKELSNVQNEIIFFKDKRLSAMREHNDTLEKLDLTSDTLNWYSEFREELKRYGVPVGDTKLIANLERWLRESRANPTDIVKQFENYTELIREHGNLSVKVKELRKTADDLDEKVSGQNLKLSEIEKLKAMCMGLNSMKRLYNTLKEIAEENQLSTESAVSRFFADVENEYSEVVGFERRIIELKELYEKLNDRYGSVSSKLSAIPHVGGAVASLQRRGVNEDEIVRICSILNSRPESFKTLLSNKNDSDKEPSQSSNTDKKGSDLKAHEDLNWNEKKRDWAEAPDLLSALSGLSRKYGIGRSEVDIKSD